MHEKLLVINADDLGFSADINETIEEGHRAGYITNATVMVDGNATAGGLAVARRNPQLGVGLHLDLCPITGFYELPYAAMKEGLLATVMQQKVADEVERQIQKFKGFGLEFTHMDSHRHFHALPEIFHLVVTAAAAHGLKTIRLTKDWILPKTPSVYWTEDFFRSAKEFLRLNKIMFPNNFVYGAGEYSAASFECGLNELMVHVAYKDEYFLKEYQRVSSPAFWRDIHSNGIRVNSYRDVAELLPLESQQV